MLKSKAITVTNKNIVKIFRDVRKALEKNTIPSDELWLPIEKIEDGLYRMGGFTFGLPMLRYIYKKILKESIPKRLL